MKRPGRQFNKPLDLNSMFLSHFCFPLVLYYLLGHIFLGKLLLQGFYRNLPRYLRLLNVYNNENTEAGSKVQRKVIN